MVFRIPTYLLSILVLISCSGPGYYLQAISGQWKLVHARQDIQSLLDNPSTSTALSTNLKAANQIRAFALSELDLPSDGSYSNYVEVDGDAVVWNVIATKEFSLQPKKWCFPVAGCVPYRGFFKQQAAIESAERLRNKGMDVMVSPATAYSSLGWFNDPLLSTMLSGSDIRLAAYLFHELAHQRLYLKSDGKFNEGYASFVEESAVKLWLESNQRQDEYLHWKELQAVNSDFTGLITETRDQLADLFYSSETIANKRKLKADIFLSLARSYEQLVVEKWRGQRYYKAWFEDPLNNAKLALYDTYEGSQCAFRDLMEQAGGSLPEFHRLARQKSELKKVERQKWLRQSCTSIAHEGHL